MRDELVGYLLGALEPDEHARVEEYLKSDPEGTGLLEKLRRTLALLQADAGEHDPPLDLAQRTLRRIRQTAATPLEVGAGSAEGGWRLRDMLFAAGTCIR
jgi:anti-sigma-K factor RskA